MDEDIIDTYCDYFELHKDKNAPDQRWEYLGKQDYCDYVYNIILKYKKEKNEQRFIKKRGKAYL